MKTLYESLLDNNLENQLDTMLNIWDIKTSKEYLKKAENLYNIIKEYPVKKKTSKFDFIDSKDLKKDKWYIETSYTSVGLAFDIFCLSMDYKFRINYWNKLDLLLVPGVKNTIYSTSLYEVPESLNFWIKELKEVFRKKKLIK